jgi:histidinol-phosphatase (PHP family)
MCQQAMKLGLKAIAFTEHVEWHPSWRQLAPDFPAYWKAIEECRREFGPQGLTVLSGIELGNPSEHLQEANRIMGELPFDLIVGSVHWIYDINIHERHLFSGREAYSVYGDYFAKIEEMALTVELTFVAHFDRIFAAGVPANGQFEPARIEGQIRRTLAAIAGRGQALELNTRFLAHRPNWNLALLTMYRWFREEGGKHVVVNSDAHNIHQLARNFDIAEKLLADAGYDAVGLPQVESATNAP